MTGVRIDAALREARARLVDSPSAARDAEVLLCHVLARPRSYLFTWPEALLDAAQHAAFEALLARRTEGEPVAHLTGEREFFGRAFRVTADTLIPRPDTEVLIETVLSLSLPAQARGVDLGTGTGIIGITLALEKPLWQMTLVDVSAPALAVAQSNARQLSAKVNTLNSHWLDACSGPFDVIVSNPPYIDQDDVHLQQGDVRFEPRSALVAQEQGLADIRVITQQAQSRLCAGGWLAFEHGYNQGEAVRELLSEAGFSEVRTVRDYGGNERVTVGQYV